MSRYWRIAAFSSALALLGACAKPPVASLPDLYAVPDFTLTAQDGREFLSTRELKGKVWVAQFIFTTCTGPCPRMTTLMSRIQEATASMPEVKLVSFTVDPTNDTPPALADYGRRYKADFTRWSLLTGERSALHFLKREAFKLGDVDAAMNHSTRMVLIDRNMRVRAFPESDDPQAVEKAVADIRSLLAE